MEKSMIPRILRRKPVTRFPRRKRQTRLNILDKIMKTVWPIVFSPDLQQRNSHANASQSSVSDSQPIPPPQNDLLDELNPPESRLSKSPSQSSVSASQPIPSSQNDLSDELNPPESRLSKSPSQSSVSASQAEDLSSGVKTKAKTAAATDKLKALKFLAAILRIGHWEVKEKWIFLLINVVLKVLLVAFEQCASPKKPHYSLIAMVVSIVAMFICIIELFDSRRKASKQRGQRSRFYYLSSSEKSFHSFVDMFALTSGVVQCIFSVVAYCHHRRGRENPIKVSVVSVIFMRGPF